MDTKRHIAYFKRCLGILPTSFQSEDSNKLAILYFSLAGLDLLGGLESGFSVKEREDFVHWIYSHEVETEDYYGFRGSQIYSHTGLYDPPNLAATCFALQSLLILGNDLSRINRAKMMRYVVKCQRQDGSFAPVLDMETGLPLGEEDTRYCMLAATIRKIAGAQGEQDIDCRKLLEYIRSAQSFDGGLSMGTMCESHAGLTFCGIDALKLTGTLEPQHWQHCLDFLVHRQIWFGEYNSRELKENEYASTSDNGGFNGRLNKYGDTCYAFWSINSLQLLGAADLVDRQAIQKFLLEGTQNTLMGGFNKVADDDAYPDPLHSFLAVATLSLLGYPGIAPLDSELVISQRASKGIQ